MPSVCHLLAVDVGLHTGLAFFDESARLLWYRSHHLSTPQKLKKIIAKLLRDSPRPTHIYLEGGGPLADLWRRDAERLGITVSQVQAEQWRGRLLYPRQHLSGAMAKREAGDLARQAIHRLGGKKPTQLRHDTAEAILVGLYALLELGWLEDWPTNRG
jgi:ferredoxin-NADP reductase